MFEGFTFSQKHTERGREHTQVSEWGEGVNMVELDMHMKNVDRYQVWNLMFPFSRCARKQHTRLWNAGMHRLHKLFYVNLYQRRDLQ